MTTASSSSKIFADRIGRIEVSATMAVAAEAAKLRAQGANLVDFGAGEPHFPTPRHIKDAAIAAIEANFSKYTVVPGIPDVRKAIVDRHAADFGSDYGIDEAIFTTGGKLALFDAIQVLVDHGDEVILPVPYWVSFKDIIQYAGGKVVFLETQEAENFRVTADAIEKAITPKTKAIILYIEQITDGKGFMEVVSEVAKVKPVVAIKAGSSRRGSRGFLIGGRGGGWRLARPGISGEGRPVVVLDGAA